MSIVNALELYVLGRTLSRIAEDAMRGPGAPDVPPGLRLVMADVAEHPGTAIGEVAARTGLPQGYVSTCVARLRARGAVETGPDPADRRRTLVEPGAEFRTRAARARTATAGDALRAALGDAPDADELAAAAARLALRLRERGAA